MTTVSLDYITRGWGTDEAYAEWLRQLPKAPEPSPGLRAPGPAMFPGHYLIEWTCPRPGCAWRKVLWDFVPRLTVEEMLREHFELDNAGPYQTAASSVSGRNHKSKFHVVAPGGSTACGGRVELLPDQVLASKVKLGLRCARAGCSERWPMLNSAVSA